MDYIAHRIAESGDEQALIDHLKQVAERACEFAAFFNSAEIAYRAGLLHDIGKYSEAFQRRIRGSSEQTDHSTAGAQVALYEAKDIYASFCIAGHHAGLPNLGTARDEASDATLRAKLKRKAGEHFGDYSQYLKELELPICEARVNGKKPNEWADDAFFTRMLYSCLVDADFLDTEGFMQQGDVARGSFAELPQLWTRLTDTVEKRGWRNGKSGLNALRSEILTQLAQRALERRGLFTLTVPTGGGKTVSSMVFALRHALHNNQRRVIYIIPYTSIIEQTQSVFEGIFGKENVIAHFANVDYSNDEQKLRDTRHLAAENWDAPIVLTTAVQFFESLYANRSSRCRKLHNIANSVLIFDEAQMLPVPYLQPCVHAISQLVKNYGCTALLCTATQPALNPLFEKEGLAPIELCPRVQEMYKSFRRVRYENAGVHSTESLAQELNKREQLLCIVNTRKQAKAVFELLQGEGCYHLSTWMYPAHRRAVLSEIRERLKSGEPCRVISTSLIEAGVDVDFPCVWRQLAGLDSIIQAGGRCNREGRNSLQDSVVYFFDSDEKPPKAIEKNISAARRTVKRFEDIAHPDAIDDYFSFLLYTLKGEDALDAKRIMDDLYSQRFPFADIAERFHLIEQEERTIYISTNRSEALIHQLRQFGPSRSLMRQLGQYAVGVYPYQYEELIRAAEITPIAENAAVLVDESRYKQQTGLDISEQEAKALIF